MLTKRLKEAATAAFQYLEGATVALRADYPGLGLRAGDRGVVWALYGTTPPAYDVTFQGQDGRRFDMLLDEDELTDPADERSPREAPASQEAASPR